MTEMRNGMVSVIVPVYNGARTIVRAIDSALAQQGVDLEVVVVDDASQDNTAGMLERHYAGDERVRIFRSESNGGPSAARNRAMDEARGEWLAVLDADDRYQPGRLARLLAAAQEFRADLVADAYGMCDPESLQTFALRGVDVARGPLAAADLLRHNIGSCKPVFRTQFLRAHAIRYQPAVRHAEDLLLLVDLLLAGAHFHFEPQPGYDKIVEPTSLTANREQLLPGVIAVHRQLLARPAIQADAELRATLQEHLRYVLDAEAAHRLQGTLRRAGVPALLLLLLRDPGLALAAVRHLLLRSRRFAQTAPARRSA